MKYRVLNTTDITLCSEIFDVFDEIAEVDHMAPDRSSIEKVIGNYHGYLCSLEIPVDRDFLSRASNLMVIGSPSTGTDHLDLIAIEEAGITCFDISKEYDLINSFTATAELAFASLLALNRKICRASEAVLQGLWPREQYCGFQLSGKVLGLIGLGRLGSICARIGSGFGMNVIGCDIRQVCLPSVKQHELEYVIRNSDVIMLNVHLNSETKGMIGRRELGMMKSGAFIVNTSRGALLDECALIDFLGSGHIGGACLDLIDGEWLENKKAHPLVRYAKVNNNLLISPHIGGATKESIFGARKFMANKLANYFRELN